MTDAELKDWMEMKKLRTKRGMSLLIASALKRASFSLSSLYMIHPWIFLNDCQAAILCNPIYDIKNSGVCP